MLARVIFIGFFLLFFSCGMALAFSPCHMNMNENHTTYVCDWNSQIYQDFQTCYSACVVSFEGSGVSLHVSRSFVEVVYLLSGVLLGVLFISAILVGMR